MGNTAQTFAQPAVFHGIADANVVGAAWSKDIARAVRIAPGSTQSSLQGWVLNGNGNLDSFGAITNVVPPPFGGPWPNWDIAVQLVLQ